MFKGRNLDLLSCIAGPGFPFLKCLVDREVAHASIKVQTAAILSSHKEFGGIPIFSHPLAKCFLQGVKRQRPVSVSLHHFKSLPGVHSFEPLQRASLWALSVKTAMPLALAFVRT